MTYTATREKAQDLKQMGLTNQGLKKGSRMGPLLLVALVLVFFVGSLVDTEPLPPLEQLILAQHKETQSAGARKASVCSIEQQKEDAKTDRVQQLRRGPANDHIERGWKALVDGTSDAEARREFVTAVNLDPCAANKIGEVWRDVHHERARKLLAERARLLADRSKALAEYRQHLAVKKQAAEDHKKHSEDFKRFSAIPERKDTKDAVGAPATADNPPVLSDPARRAEDLVATARKLTEFADDAARAAAEKADRAGKEVDKLTKDADRQFNRANERYLALMPDGLQGLLDDQPFNRVVDLFLPFGVRLRGTIQKLTGDFLGITMTGLKTIGWLLAFALVAGVAGLVYRRAFWTWFLLAIAAMLAINVVGEFGSISNARLTGSEPLYLLVASQWLLLIFAFRLRRHSTDNSSTHRLSARLYNSILVFALVIVGFMVLGLPLTENSFPWLSKALSFIPKIPGMEEVDNAGLLLSLDITLLVLPTIYLLFKRRVTWSGTQPKSIVVCLDGTWNTPEMRDFGHLAHTNVYKLFKSLKEDNPDSKVASALRRVNAMFDASICKRFRDRQIAFYYSGVGNKLENSEIGQLLGGATGMGAAGIVERAYLDVMRVWRPGDRIFIFGFSRGAAIARLLTRALDQRGAPRKMWTLRFLGRHWVLWKSRRHTREVPVDVLGCWDTVGSFGVAKSIAGINFQKIDLFKDLTVPDNVEQAYHMVALDETRDAFEPTLMEPDPIKPGRIVEVWFTGDHGNVGGGYATDKLSDITLDFLLKLVSSGYAHSGATRPGDETWGIYLCAGQPTSGNGRYDDETDIVIVDPDPLGQLRTTTSMLYKTQHRNVPLHAVIHDTVFERMKEAVPIYAPQALFNFNAELAQKRATIEAEVTKLWETKSLDDAERDRILTWSRQKLSLSKWLSNVPAGSSRSSPSALTGCLANDVMTSPPVAPAGAM